MLTEFYSSDSAPHAALGRFARRLSGGGAVYLGGGIGVEKLRGKDSTETFSVTQQGKKAESFPGPLSATIRGFALAGQATDASSPGGAVQVADPAVAARLAELSELERDRRQDIQRFERRIAARTPPVPYMPGRADDDAWEVRRLAELKVELRQIAEEKVKLLAGGSVEEVEQVRPGTNFTKIPAANVAKLAPLVKHYKGLAHPFATCVRDQVKHGLTEDHAKRRCAVVKDLGEGTTKWRKGSKKVSEQAELLIAEALERVGLVERQLGEGASVMFAEMASGSQSTSLAQLAEGMANDYGLLAMAGHPLGLALYGLAEAFGDATAQTPTPAASRSAGPGGRAGGGGKYDESKHKRASKGQTGGGRFVSKGGASDVEARTVQHRLGVATDGKFGDKTAAAVREFQRAHGLQVDGVVGRQTLAAMAGKKNAKDIAPGALTAADRRELRKIRSSQTRRRATGGGRTKRDDPAEDSPEFNWRKHGNKRRGVKLKNGGTQVVSAAEYDRLKRQGKLHPSNKRMRGD